MNYYRFDLSPLMGSTTLDERLLDRKYNTRHEQLVDAKLLGEICIDTQFRTSVMRFNGKHIFGFTLSDAIEGERTDCWFFCAMEEDYTPFQDTEEGKRIHAEALAFVAELEAKRKAYLAEHPHDEE